MVDDIPVLESRRVVEVHALAVFFLVAAPNEIEHFRLKVRLSPLRVLLITTSVGAAAGDNYNIYLMYMR